MSANVSKKCLLNSISIKESVSKVPAQFDSYPIFHNPSKKCETLSNPQKQGFWHFSFGQFPSLSVGQSRVPKKCRFLHKVISFRTCYILFWQFEFYKKTIKKHAGSVKIESNIWFSTQPVFDLFICKVEGDCWLFIFSENKLKPQVLMLQYYPKLSVIGITVVMPWSHEHTHF